MSGGHGHSHHGHHHHGHHHHGHAAGGGDARWLIGIGLNSAFVVAEVAAGLAGRSMALLADAGHNLSDVMSLALAAAAAWLARRPSAPRRTYGFGKATVLAALANAVLLVFACGFIASEAIARLKAPAAPASGLMMAVAAAGVVINGATALLFTHGRAHDVNVRSAFLHMTADAAISAGVVAAGAAILFTGAGWIDPAASLAIVAVILWGSWGVLREAFDLAMDAAPAGVDVAAVRTFLEACPGVSAVHDLHVWPLSTTETALTAHLVRAGGGDDAFLKGVCRDLHARFGVGHATLQVEVESLEACEELHA
jgi:cobalt-zinc-cadmium efflux system protein